MVARDRHVLQDMVCCGKSMAGRMECLVLGIFDARSSSDLPASMVREDFAPCTTVNVLNPTWTARECAAVPLAASSAATAIPPAQVKTATGRTRATDT